VLQRYLKNTRTTFGVHGLPNGLAYYNATLKWQLSEEFSPEYIHNKGLEEVKRVFGLMEQVDGDPRM